MWREARGSASGAWVPALEDRLRVCTDRFAVRHRFVDEATGEVLPMLCGKYSCEYCGPRRVEAWRSIIELAEPERFMTLSRVGLTLVEVGRVATVLARRLRRLGFQFEYCTTFERHRNGYYHIHMLQKGDYIPQKLLSDCLRTATHGFSFVAHIAKCKPGTAGYVTKYCTKVLAASDIGAKPDGTKARVNRVRYSKGFFPSPTAMLRAAMIEQWKEHKRLTGEAVPDYAGSFKLHEFAQVPRDDRGRVNEAAANEQYYQLVAARVEQASIEPVPLSKGGRAVLAYMVLESLQCGEVATV